MLETLIAMGAACVVFFLFLFVFFLKDRRERSTGRRSGCQNHDQIGSCGHCRGQMPPDRKPVVRISDRK
ncbi:MAG: hypothetical protein JJV98_18755 [Desulfosarcina sp.]|nr:hypothetical protein [Desulfobacterales bacterium]